ncbi:unnamed protein product [Brassica oleracea]|uniref:(rape) hypothetical protein n=1 Tax=Brassica napus TaxID=3708 RepID=A0A816KDH2_BRANA|nr:unnamed protein product [Brassica napus]
MKCEANPKNEPQWREPLLNLDDIIKLIRGGGELEIRSSLILTMEPSLWIS